MKNAELVKKAKEVLTPTELKIFRQLNTQYLVPFIQGAPGIGKTATLEDIANKLGMVYVDMRLPTKDETDLGVYPVVNKIEYGDITINKIVYGIPEWATDTWDNPDKNYLIVFEELNRATKSVRDAAMGIVLERRVGHNFKFKSNVFIAATGNMGEQDGTEVEELDFAQKDRFIIHQIKPNLLTWIDDYARENVHPDIIKYLENHPADFYPDLKTQDDDAVVTPRKWTGFSDFIVANTEGGLQAKLDEYHSLVEESGSNFIGPIMARFHKFIHEGRMLTAAEVLAGSRKKDYDGKWPNGTPKINRDNKAEVLTELKDGMKGGSINVQKLTKRECENLKDFFLHMRDTDNDMLTGLVYDAFHLMNDVTKDMTREQVLKIPFISMLWDNFKKELDYVHANRKVKDEAEVK